MQTEVPERQIRAVYDDYTIRVYQAYSTAIAELTLKHRSFSHSQFKLNRMTWIKPSFLWMMYRSGWGKKDLGQCRILAIDILRIGFEWALKNSCVSTELKSIKDPSARLAYKASFPVRIQWDPERDIDLKPLSYKNHTNWPIKASC